MSGRFISVSSRAVAHKMAPPRGRDLREFPDLAADDPQGAAPPHVATTSACGRIGTALLNPYAKSVS